jgi:hypothetical protein
MAPPCSPTSNRRSPQTLFGWRRHHKLCLPSHKVAGVCDVTEARGAKLVYSPAYSSDLNPMELAFARFKALLRRSPLEPLARYGRIRRPTRPLHAARTREPSPQRGLCSIQSESASGQERRCIVNGASRGTCKRLHHDVYSRSRFLAC